MKGWLLDLYPSGEDEMTLWLKSEGGEVFMLKDEYRPVLYVYAPSKDLEMLEPELEESETAIDWAYVRRRARLRDLDESRVLEIECSSMKRFPHFARKLVRLGDYRDYYLYNVDIPHAQAYLLRKGLFPLAKVRVEGLAEIEFELLDSAESHDYELPPLKYSKLHVGPEKGGQVPSPADPISEISLSFDGEELKIDEGDEEAKIRKLVQSLRDEDPDLILTKGGDSWDLPYLAKRADEIGISEDLILGREAKPLERKGGRGTSYFSYGRIYYRPPPHHLRGRIHIDANNSFIYGECGLEGLIELSRMTRTPLQRMSRRSIGSAMTNLQLYRAQENGILVPWMKREPEEFKSAWKLLEADRGGFIFEPRIGIHEDVGEIDFGSFYPAMMERYNISPETILCDCCPDSDNRVPELGYNICERRRGLIPQVLKPVLAKRRKYKKMAEEASGRELEKIYERRQEALKWILVTCFGYLGYRNARFGRIEAHEAVTAYARRNLLRASRMAEERGFEVVHGIVDSLWVKKADVTHSELKSLCDWVKDEIGLPIRPEGRYRWIVFQPSKESPRVPVLNRYFGVFDDGKLKVRGLKVRRRDTPQFVKDAQRGMLDRIKDAETAEEFEEMIPESLKVVKEYSQRLRRKNVDIRDLAVRKQLSRHPESYQTNARSAVAAKQLMEAGDELRAGQQVAYIVTDVEAENPRFRVRPLQLLERGTKYDVRWYIDQLLDAAEEIFGPFGYRKERIRSEILSRWEQKKLKA